MVWGPGYFSWFTFGKSKHFYVGIVKNGNVQSGHGTLNIDCIENEQIQ